MSTGQFDFQNFLNTSLMSADVSFSYFLTLFLGMRRRFHGKISLQIYFVLNFIFLACFVVETDSDEEILIEPKIGKKKPGQKAKSSINASKKDVVKNSKGKAAEVKKEKPSESAVAKASGTSSKEVSKSKTDKETAKPAATGSEDAKTNPAKDEKTSGSNSSTQAQPKDSGGADSSFLAPTSPPQGRTRRASSVSAKKRAKALERSSTSTDELVASSRGDGDEPYAAIKSPPRKPVHTRSNSSVASLAAGFEKIALINSPPGSPLTPRAGKTSAGIAGRSSRSGSVSRSPLSLQGQSGGDKSVSSLSLDETSKKSDAEK